MAWITSFIAEISKYIVEAPYLWGITAGVVAVASGVHYVLASGERKDLRKRSEKQKEKEGFGKSSRA
jgi:hypothetical protein